MQCIISKGLVMKWYRKQSFRTILRSLHRDLGYLFVGLTIIYGISGIILNGKETGKDPAFREITVIKNLSQHLSPKELTAVFNQEITGTPPLQQIIKRQNSYRVYLQGGVGEYMPDSGLLELTIYKEKKLVRIINNIHNNSGKRFTSMANVYAVGLLFLAISGTIMLKGKKGFLKRGIWFVLIGLIIPILMYLLKAG